jgi:hypothetical protein
VLLKPFANAGDCTFIRIGRGVWPMKYADFIEQHHRNAATFSFADVCAKLYKECFNVSPLNVGADRTGVNGV